MPGCVQRVFISRHITDLLAPPFRSVRKSFLAIVEGAGTSRYSRQAPGLQLCNGIAQNSPALELSRPLRDDCPLLDASQIHPPAQSGDNGRVWLGGNADWAGSSRGIWRSSS